MTRKKPSIGRRDKYWYKRKAAKPPESDNHVIQMDNVDCDTIIASEIEVSSESPSPKKVARLLDHTYLLDHAYSAVTDVSSSLLDISSTMTELADKCVKTEPVDVTLCGDNNPSCSYVPTEYEALLEDIRSFELKPFLFNKNSPLIQFIECYSCAERPSVKWTVTINEQFGAKIIVHNKEISNENDFWIGLPAKFNTIKDISELLNKLSSYSVCCGNSVEEFQDLVPIEEGLSDNIGPGIISYMEGDFSAQKGTLSNSTTIRSLCCSFLTYGSRCSPCSKYRESLQERKHRIQERKNGLVPNDVGNTHKPSDMDRDALVLKLKQQKVEMKTLEQDNLKMKRLFQKHFQSNGILMNEVESVDVNDLYKSLVERCTNDISHTQEMNFPEQYASDQDQSQHGEILEKNVSRISAATETSIDSRDVQHRSKQAADIVYKCEKCSEEYTNFRSLYHHREKCNGKRFKCGSCENEFTTDMALQLHVMQIHSDTTPYQCDIVDMKFTFPYGLKGQKSKVHSNWSKHADSELFVFGEKNCCKICKSYFRYEGSLIHHIILSHQNLASQNEILKSKIKSLKTQTDVYGELSDRLDQNLKQQKAEISGEIEDNDPKSEISLPSDQKQRGDYLWKSEISLPSDQKQIEDYRQKSEMSLPSDQKQTEEYRWKSEISLPSGQNQIQDCRRKSEISLPSEENQIEHCRWESEISLLSDQKQIDDNLWESELHVSLPTDQTQLDINEITDETSFSTEEKLGEKIIKDFKCKFCTRRFKYRSSLYRHEFKHSGIKLHACKICEKQFATSCELKIHVRIHADQKLFKCGICGSSFAQRHHLTSHMSIHTGFKPHKCTKCGKGFARKDQLTYHLKHHLKQRVCKVCGKDYIWQDSVKRRIRDCTCVYLRTSKKDESPKVTNFQCEFCGKHLSTLTTLNQHILNHTEEKPYYRCTICNKEYRQFPIYKSHVLSHEDGNPFKCNICEKSFPNRSYLSSHIKRHSGVRPYQCDICGKLFTQSSHRNKHMDGHSGLKPYQCSECGKRFTHTTNLKEHAKLHAR